MFDLKPQKNRKIDHSYLTGTNAMRQCQKLREQLQMPITVWDICNALETLGGEAHYADIAAQVMKVATPPFPVDPQASVRARLQERCSDYKAYKHQLDLFESESGSGVWRFRTRPAAPNLPTALNEERADYEAEEGGIILRAHFARERDATLVKKFKASLEDPRCEACGMNFAEVYGDIGIGYIEAHHKTPISMLQEGNKTTLADLAGLCANCHRIIHKNQPMTVEQLAAILAMPGGFASYMDAARKSRTTWKDAVHSAIKRLVAARQSTEFTRHDIIETELAAITGEVGSKGETPEQTLSRVLQELRQAEIIEFLDNQGAYRLK
jgi:putative restriction endonuclease